MDLKIEHGRYIILGSIDGILAVLGVVIGASVSGNPSFVVSAAIGGALALALSKCVGLFMTGGAVEYSKLSSLEKPMLRSLENTKLEEQTKKKIWTDSLVHGGSSFAGSMIPVIPFILLEGRQLETAVALSIATLTILGIYSGKIAQKSIILHSIGMVGLGLLVVLAVAVGLGTGH